MNYYHKYPGDYAGDTAHLSLTEHGAYNKLMDYCYGKDTIEIPNSDEIRCRVCGAVTRREKEAVRNVVKEFFPDGINNRIARQLPEELKRVDIARANGALGGRPRKEPSGLPKENPTGNPAGNPAGYPAQKLTHTHSHSTTPPPTPTPDRESYSLSLPDAEDVKSTSSLSCAESCANGAQPPAPNGSGVFLKTCKKGGEWEVPADKITEWEESYPDVDVKLTLLGIRQWLNDNPTRRKTHRGMVRFIGAWMMREQDKPDLGAQNAKTTKL